MDNLIKKLEEEAGLTEEQAVKAVVTIKNFMDKEGLKIDWGKFFNQKVDQYSDKAKELFNQLIDKTDNLMDKAREGIKDLGSKSGHFFG
ncbi:hypothetical protein [Parabacteroides sp. Marseille-P3160]|mgnify:CR=1 FL=1|uniref:hypothetical protein n=1 Tax=Parabacteroides sp. Marseille-P3160 TaxID=1917887 RepID=UPI0009BAC9C7|nr:hypothetical protein [Parabacteroides sp. Marseille-P3160]